MQCLIKRQLTACTSHPHKDDSILDKKNLYYIAMMMRKTWYFPCYCQRLCHFYFTTVVRMKVQIFVWQKKTTPSPFCGIYLMLWMRSDNPTITKFFFFGVWTIFHVFKHKLNQYIRIRLCDITSNNMDSICYIWLYNIMNCKWPTNIKWFACKLCHCRD